MEEFGVKGFCLRRDTKIWVLKRKCKNSSRDKNPEWREDLVIFSRLSLKPYNLFSLLMVHLTFFSTEISKWDRHSFLPGRLISDAFITAWKFTGGNWNLGFYPCRKICTDPWTCWTSLMGCHSLWHSLEYYFCNSTALYKCTDLGLLFIQLQF